MNQKTIPLAERALFLSGVTFLGGYLNSYTYATRGGIMANNHTGDMSKLGIMLAQGEWSAALTAGLMILAAVFGAVLSEVLRVRFGRDRDWRRLALALEAAALAAVAFVPATVPDLAVNVVMSVVSGFQLCLFRTSQWGAHNTTICTGNLRTVGQFLFGAFNERTAASWSRFVKYTALVLSFVVGSAAGVPLCAWVGTYASLAGSAVALVLLAAMIRDGR